MQRRAAQGAMGGCCGPLASLELHRAPRSARRETVKGRDAAESRATRDAPRWSDASQLLAAVQLRAELSATLCTQRNQGPRRSGELRKARRSEVE